MRTDIDLKFGDGTYTFRLPLPQIAELQRKTGTGIGALYAKLLKGRYVLQGHEEGDTASIGDPSQADYAALEVLEPIRLGLIGGGLGRVNGEPVVVDPVLAGELMEAYAYPARPLSEAWTLAVAILTACVEGYVEPDKKKEPDEPEQQEAERTTPEDGSTIPAPSETLHSPDAPQ